MFSGNVPLIPPREVRRPAPECRGGASLLASAPRALLTVGHYPECMPGGMYDFSGEQLLDREQVRRRLRRMTDDQLRRWGSATRYICTPAANLGQPWISDLHPARRFRSVESLLMLRDHASRSRSTAGLEQPNAVPGHVVGVQYPAWLRRDQRSQNALAARRAAGPAGRARARARRRRRTRARPGAKSRS
jgi:hypothetical protein